MSSSFIFLALLFTSINSTPTSNNLLPIPLQISSPKQTPKTLRKFSSSPSEVNFNHSNSNLFLLPITLGTPPQTLNVIIDTGSFTLYVGNEECKDRLTFVNYFNPSNSSTFFNTTLSFSTFYVKGNIFGILGQDIITINNMFNNQSGINFQFGVASSSGFLNPLDNDGIFGFGNKYTLKSEHNISESIMHSLLENKIISKNVFSLFYIQDQPTGMMYIGDYHSNFTTENNNYIAKCNLTQEGYYDWACKLNNVMLNNKTALNITGDLIFDSGTNGIHFPNSTLETFFNATNKSDCDTANLGQNVFSLVCNSKESTFDISFVVNGYRLKIKKELIWMHIVENEYDLYLLLIDFIPNSNLMILGFPGFVNYHILFDAEKQQLMFYSYEGIIYNENGGDNGGESDGGNSGVWHWILDNKALLIVGFSIVVLFIALIGVICVCKKKAKEDGRDTTTIIDEVLSQNERQLLPEFTGE